MLQKAGFVVQQATEMLGISASLRRYQIQAAWETVTGGVMASQSVPTSLKGEILFVRTSSSHWSQELMLRQSEIVAKLNRLLPGKNIRSLRCRVGRVEALAAPPPTPETAWKDVELTEEARERAARIAGGVADPALRESLWRSLLQLERKRAWGFRQGLRPCALCGFLQDEPLCRSCWMERQRQRQTKIFQALGKRPWCSYDDLKDLVGRLTPAEFFQAKRRLRSILEQNYRAAREVLPVGGPFPPGLRQVMVDLVMLSTGVELAHLNERHVYYTFGKWWGKAYLENVVPDIAAMREKWKATNAGRPKRHRDAKGGDSADPRRPEAPLPRPDAATGERRGRSADEPEGPGGSARRDGERGAPRRTAASKASGRKSWRPEDRS